LQTGRVSIGLKFQKVIDANQLFDNRYLESKKLYLYHFDFIPSVYYVNGVDGENTFEKFNEKFGSYIEVVHNYRWYHPQKKKFEFDRTIIVLNNGCIVEFSSDYCEILHNSKSDVFIKDVIELVMTCKGRKKRQPTEINLVVRDGSRLDLKIMEVKKKKLNLDFFYEDEFKEVDAVIQKRLRQKNDKGIVLLHGLPGTGKTTYIRYLITRLKKRVLFLSPNIAGDLMNPEFIDLLIDNPNTVLIIEDAENIIMDRRNANNSSVSNLLNISDGLLADFLNVQLICTFNSPLTMVDNALMRKGRLIAKYEFGKLSVAKSQKLSDHFGFRNIIAKPMTIAEISNQHEKEIETKQTEVIGFRRELIMEN